MSQPKELSGRIGKYEILRVLGRGAMGIVYLAHDTVLERDVALKLMASTADDPATTDRFTREAKAVAKMTHPNVVTVFDLGSHTDGSPFIAMELLKGQDLQRALRVPPAPTLERKLSVLVQVLAGLDHAHHAGIIHRDIKPANIFLCSDGTVKIMDFGVARLATGSMTGTGNIVGTADYMSPEQVKGAKVDGRSDLFSVGAMLYEMLTGHRPFHADNLMAIFYKITHEEPDYDLLPQGGEAKDLLPILKRAMSKVLDARYQTAREMAFDLRDYLRSHATTTSTARALDDLLDTSASGTHDVFGATVVEGDAGFQTFRPAPTAPATTSPDLGETIVERQATAAPAARASVPPRPETRPRPTAPVAEPAGSKAPLVAGGAAVLVLLAGVGAWLALRGPTPDPAAPSPSPTAVAQVTPAPPSIATGPSTAPSSPTAMPTATAIPSAAPTRVAVEPPPLTTATLPPATLPPPVAPTRPPATLAPRTAQINTLLARADDALVARNYDAAIAAYDEALALDAQNAPARQGRSTAIQARTLATAAAAVPAGRTFVSGKTKATSAETKAASTGPEGFETGGEVAVKSGSQVALLPGKVVFDVDPERVKPGDAYKVRIYLLNEGNAPIQVQGLSVATTINGRVARGPLPPQVKEVAPRQRALLREVQDTWKEETNGWSMEATVRTTRGEVYTNQVAWQ
jgi:tRNA A-37 threonylcarbamoyl transferase component Bud32